MKTKPPPKQTMNDDDENDTPIPTSYETFVGPPTAKGLKNMAKNPQTGCVVFQGEDMFNLDELSLRIIEQINSHPQKLTPLARAAFDARSVLSESLDKIGTVMDEFKAKLREWLEEVRAMRMNFVSETNQMLGPLKDIRQFFLESTYEAEIARLREFVELCERLNTLKECGFLDTVAETMIRLAIKTEQ
jgi:hypothetical protein